MKKAFVECVIFGGGVAGLWTLNFLRNRGINAILLESRALGSKQTISSQGILHSGIKYLWKNYELVEKMLSAKNCWEESLQGNGEIDLSQVKILANNHKLWSTQKISSKIASFFASKLFKSRCRQLNKDELPEMFSNRDFCGSIYELDEKIVDIKSTIEELSKPYIDFIYYTGSSSVNIVFENEKIARIDIDEELSIIGEYYIFLAGENNKKLLGDKCEIKTRPLRMSIIKFEECDPMRNFYGHCVEMGTSPVLTITTHTDKEGRQVWYVGGKVSEDGARMDEKTHVLALKVELWKCMPWINFDNCQISSFTINRAENVMKKHFFINQGEDIPYATVKENIIIGWPIKFVLAPILARKIFSLMDLHRVYCKKVANIELPTPSIAQYIWD